MALNCVQLFIEPDEENNDAIWYCYCAWLDYFFPKGGPSVVLGEYQYAIFVITYQESLKYRLIPGFGYVLCERLTCRLQWTAKVRMQPSIEIKRPYDEISHCAFGKIDTLVSA